MGVDDMGSIALASMALLNLSDAKLDIMKLVELQPSWPKTNPQKQGTSLCWCFCVCVHHTTSHITSHHITQHHT